MDPNNRLKISIVIPTKNEARHIKEAMESMDRSSVFRENVEVIVVDGHSEDDTVKIVSEYSAKVLYESTGTRGGACNVGWKNSNGDIIVLTDGDCLFTKDWISKIEESFRDSELAVIGGTDLTPPTSTSYLEIAGGLLDESRAQKEKTWFGHSFHIRGCNVAYRKIALVKSGGFDEKLKTAEDFELNYRLQRIGFKLAFDPSIIVYHKRRSSVKACWKQFYWYGYGLSQFVRKYPVILIAPDIFIPLLVTLLFMFFLVLSSFNGIFLNFLYLILLIPTGYVGSILLRIRVSAGKRVKFFPGVFLVFIIRQIALVAGFFVSSLTHHR